MSAEDKYMDDQFRKAAEAQHFPYKPEFWNEMESQLADDLLDTAFRGAAGSFMVMPDLNIAEEIGDAFLDDAFKAAASKSEMHYQSELWSQFLADKSTIEQDVAYTDAANAIKADYQPAFWNDADMALQSEGLHYEYKSTYWSEARELLDRSDRKVFFFRWSSVAALLLLLSVGGIYQGLNTAETPVMAHNYGAELALKSNPATLYYTAVTENDLNSIDLVLSDQSDLALGENDQPDQNEVTLTNNSMDANQGVTDPAENSYEQQNSDVANRTDDAQNDVTDFYTNQQNPDNSVENAGSIESPENGSDLVSPQISDVMVNQGESTAMTLAFTDAVMMLPSQKMKHVAFEPQSEIASPLIEIERFKLNPTHTVSFIAQAGFGNKYSTPEFVPTLRTSFGLEYRRAGFGALRNFEFGANLSLNHVRQNDFGTERKVNVFNLEGGVDKYWYKLQLKDMIYGNLSGVAYYRLDQRQSLRVSLGADYLVFVQSNMSYKVAADKGITTVNNNWGVKDGLTKFDVRLGLGYELEVSPRVSVQVNGSYGFFDRSDNEFIDAKVFDNEMNATLGLKYTFLRKL